jgi:hypothetical protein
MSMKSSNPARFKFQTSLIGSSLQYANTIIAHYVYRLTAFILNESDMDGCLRVGRPNFRWLDGVMRDVERLGFTNWRIKIKDRDGWRRLLEPAKTLHGLWCLGVSMSE